MEAFVKKIKHMRLLAVILCLLSAIMCAITFLIPGNDTNGMNYLSGFLVGITCVAVFVALTHTRTLKNPEKLKALYIKENDERNDVIAKKASQAAMALTLAGLGLASVVSAFIGEELISKTLFAVIGFTGLTVLLCKVYFKRRGY